MTGEEQGRALRLLSQQRRVPGVDVGCERLAQQAVAVVPQRHETGDDRGVHGGPVPDDDAGRVLERAQERAIAIRVGLSGVVPRDRLRGDERVEGGQQPIEVTSDDGRGRIAGLGFQERRRSVGGPGLLDPHLPLRDHQPQHVGCRPCRAIGDAPRQS
ncbi:unnamed protein product, partial [Penicillium discolor]